MNYLKLAFEHRLLKENERPRAFFDHVRGENAVLMESAADGRYSFIGYDPFLTVMSEKGVTQIEKKKNFFTFKKSPTRQMLEGEPLQVLRGLFKMFEMKGEYPVPFYGGGMGYFSYDFGCDFVLVKQKVFDDIEVPDFIFNFYDKVIAFDHQENEVYFLALAETDVSAERKVQELKNDLLKPLKLRSKGKIGELKSNLSKADYMEKIRAVKKFLYEGETYQVNFSQRFTADSTLDSWSVYKNLAKKSPAPFACYMEFSQQVIISSSPELLLRKRGNIVETWPIKGTVKRGANAAEDEKLTDELLSSEKNTAELSMIVDLQRNDLGKVCETGSVKILEHRSIQKLSHVIHTFSKIAGRLAKRKDIFDLIAAVFPGGSITGCPKKRTMCIIDQLEDYKRGVYTGSAGYISFSGDGDFNILIRTIFQKDGKIYFHSGGGIVTDSDPEKEYEETLQKALAIREILYS